MTQAKNTTNSQMFTLRAWTEAVTADRIEIRGTLKHIPSGETHHFRDWQTVIKMIESFVVTQKRQVNGGKS